MLNSVFCWNEYEKGWMIIAYLNTCRIFLMVRMRYLWLNILTCQKVLHNACKGDNKILFYHVYFWITQCKQDIFTGGVRRVPYAYVQNFNFWPYLRGHQMKKNVPYSDFSLGLKTRITAPIKSIFVTNQVKKLSLSFWARKITITVKCWNKSPSRGIILAFYRFGVQFF